MIHIPKCRNEYKDENLYKAYAARNRQANYRRGNYRLDNKRHTYTEEELQEIMEHTKTDRELAEKFKVTVQSIQLKRWRLKKQNDQSSK